MSRIDLQPARQTSVLPASLRLGAVELTVSDLDRSVAWYQRALGLRVHSHDVGVASLGAGGDTLVVLHEDPFARPAGRGTAGLYHFALNYPERVELAHAAARLAATRTAIDGASDHGTHEAIYLPDPDGNGIELAWDRARELWPSLNEMAAAQRPLDVTSLMRTVEDLPTPAYVATGLRMGHVHLHVGDLVVAERFYAGVLGFETQANLGTAAFLSAGGYHHHLAVNVWNGHGVVAPTGRTAGLRRWTIALATRDDVAHVRDRLDAAGVAVDDTDSGFLTADPFGTHVAVVHDHR